MRTLLGLGVIGAAIASLAACESYEPGPDYGEFHSTFPLTGTVHAPLACEACHAGGAAQQGLASQAPDYNWVTQLGQLCADCHPFTANEADPTAPCVESNQSERCRSERAHPNPPQNCQQCHSLYSTNGWSADAGSNPHLEAPLSQVFPLQGGHVDVGCASCHAGGVGSEAQEAGKGRFCGTCHGRERDSAPNGAAHYASPRQGAAEHERDCRACHTPLNAGGGITWPASWGEVTVNHAFLAPHRTVQAWSGNPPTVLGIDQWKVECWSCHNGWPNPADGAGVQTGPGPAQVFLSATNMLGGQTCRNGCHVTLGHNNTYDAQACWQANCHPQAGPSDEGTPGG